MTTGPAQGFSRRARPAPWRLPGVALLAAAALALPVHAQDVFLVGNVAVGITNVSDGPGLDFSSTGPSAGTAAEKTNVDPDIAQEFTTGVSLHGYQISSVDLFFQSLSGSTISGTDVPDVSVCPVDSSGNPDHTSTDCISLTLTGSEIISQHSATATDGAKFTAPMNSVLSASTTYSLYISGMGSNGRLHLSVGSREDHAGRNDWSLANTYQIYDSTDTAWENPTVQQALKVKIFGSVNPSPFPVLVSNAGQANGNSASTLDTQQAQEFTTGPNSGGYLLREVDTYVNGVRTYSVSVCPVDTNGDPDTDNCLATLTAPDIFRGESNVPNTFTSSAGVLLSASTTYSLYLVGSSTAGKLLVATTADEDDGKTDGWSIDDTYQIFSGNSWGPGGSGGSTQVVRVSLRGTAITGGGMTSMTPALVSNTTVGSNASTTIVTLDNRPSSTGNLHVSQEFTTGGNSAGYLLESVETFVTSAGTYTARVCPLDTDGDPDTANCLATLTPPSNYAASGGTVTTGGNVFTASPGIALSASTTYSLVVTGGTNDFSNMLLAETTAEDSGGATGWMLADVIQRFKANGTDWSAPSDSSQLHPLKININGRVNNGGGTPPMQGNVLIGNSGQATVDGPAFGEMSLDPVSQEFTTGPNAAGYLLESIETFTNNAGSLTPPQNKPNQGQPVHAVSVCPVDTSGNPLQSSSDCTALTRPENWLNVAHTDTSGHVFTAPADTVLSANTTYSLYIVEDSSRTGTHFHVVTSTDEDTGGAMGWSLADTYQTYAEGGMTWGNPSTQRPLKVKINGTAKSGDGTNNAPVFSPDALSRSIAENTPSGQDVGAPVTATDADSDTLTYTLQAGSDASSFTIVSTSGQIQTTGVDYNFEAKSAYTVTVVASDGTDTDTATVTITLTDVNTEAPGTPTGLTATAGSTTSLEVTWTAPANAGPAITGYGVRWCKGAAAACANANFAAADVLTVTVTSATITGLDESSEYQVQVQATNPEGTSPWSGSSSGTTGTPVNVAPVFTPDSYTREVPENSAAGANVGAAITASDANNDTLTYTLEGADAPSFAIVGTSGQIRTTTGVTYDREARSMYTVTIKATDDESASDTATVTITLTNVAELPVAPTPVTVAAVSNSHTSLSVGWTAPTIPSGTPPVTGYDVRYCKGTGTACDDDAEFTGTHAFSGTGTSTTITGVDAATTYQVRVRAKNADGGGPWATAQGTTTTPTLTVNYELTQLEYAVEGEDGLEVEVTLTAAPGRTVTIPLTRTTEFTPQIGVTGIPARLVFGATQTSRTFTVTVPDNNTEDRPPDAYSLGFGTTLPAGITAGRTAMVTVLDDDFNFDAEIADARRVVRTGNAGPPTTLRVSEGVGSLTVMLSLEMRSISEMGPTELEAIGLELEFDVYTHSARYPGDPHDSFDFYRYKAVDQLQDGSRADYVGIPFSGNPTADPPTTVYSRTLTVTAADFSEPPDFFSSASAEAEFTIEIIDDIVDEGTETFTVVLLPDYEGVTFGAVVGTGSENSLSEAESPVGGVDNGAAIFVDLEDNDPRPTPTLTLSTDTVSEGGTATERTVNLTVTMPGSQYRTDRTLLFPGTLAQRDRRLQLFYTMGTAQQGVDFTASATHVGIPRRSSADVMAGTVTVLDDIIDDADTETIVVELKEGDRVVSTATITITDDDDMPMPSLVASSTSVTEGDADSTVDLTVEMQGQYAAAQALTLDYSMGTATVGTDTLTGDFSASVQSLTIAAESSANVAAGTVTVVNDRFDEPAETIIARLMDGDRELSSVTITVADNDAAPMPSIVFNRTSVEEDSGPSFNPRVTVRFPQDGSVYEELKTLRLDYSESTATAGEDYQINQTSVQIRPNSDVDVSAGIVTLISDQLDEDPEEEQVVVELKDGTTLLSSATVTIVDDDDPQVTLEFRAAAYTAQEGGADAVVEVTISDDPERTLEFPLTQSGDADGDGLADWSGVPTAVTFTASTTQADWVRSFTVTATDDMIDDDNESVTLRFRNTLAQFAHEDLNVSFGTTTEATVSLIDNDERGVTLSETALEIDETDAAVTETYTVVLDTQPTGAVTVALTVASATVLPTLPTVSPSSLTFTASDWDTEQTVTVTVPADNDSVNEAAAITHDMSGADYAAVEDLELSVTVDDDESVPTGVTLSAAPAMVMEGDGPQQVVVTATLDNAALKENLQLGLRDSTMNELEGDGDTEADDYTATGITNLRLTIEAQNLSGTATFTLTAVDDLLYEDPEVENFVVGGGIANVLTELSRTGEPTSERLRFAARAMPANIPLGDDDPEPVLELTANRTPAAVSEQDDPGTTGLDERVAEMVLAITNGVGFEKEQTVSLAFGLTPETPAGTREAIRNRPGVTEFDYTDDAPAGDTLILGAGVVSAAVTVTVTAVDDSLDEDDGTPGVDPEDERIVVTATHEGDTAATLSLAILDDDHPVVTVRYAAESYMATEGGTDAVVAVEVMVPPGNAGPEREMIIPVTPSIADGEVAGQSSAADYSGVPAAVTFPADGTVAQEFTVTATDDDVDDDGETLTLGFGTMPDTEVSATPPVGVSTQNTEITVSLLDNDTRGLVFLPPILRASDIGQGIVGNGNFMLALASEPTVPVTVTWAAPDRLPLVTLDRAPATSAQFTPSNWSEPQEFRVIPTPDGDGVHNVVEWQYSAAGGDYASLSQRYTVQVLDQSRAADSVLLAVSPDQVTEGAGAQAITVTALGAALTVATTVSVTMSAGTASAADFTASPASVEIIILANTASAQGTFTLTATEDPIDDDDETVTVSGTATAAGLTATLSVESADVTIEDNDTAGVTLSESRLDDLAEGGQDMYTVVLDTQPMGTVTVAMVSSDSVVTVMPEQLTFNNTNWNAEQTVTVAAAEDDNPTNERVEVMHAVSGTGYEDVEVPPLVVTVDDNEEASTGVLLSLSPASLLESAVATQVVVTGTLNGGTRLVETTVSVSVSAGTAEASDYQARPSGFTLTIPAGSLAGTATFTLTPVDDGVDEFDTTVRLDGTASDGLAVTGVALTLEDDDTRGVTLSATALTVDEPGQATYTVELDSQPTAEVTVALSVASVPMVQLRVSPPVLVFTPQDYAAKTVTASVRGDADMQGGDVMVSHTVSGGDYGANAVTAEFVTVTVTDTVAITSDLEVSLDDESPLLEEGGPRTLTATVSLLSAARTVAVTATVTVTEGTATAGQDFQANPAEFTVTIPAAERMATAEFTLTPLSDEIDEDGETVLVRVAATNLTSGDGIDLTIVDDDTRAVQVTPTALAVDERDRTMYTVGLGSQPTAEVTVDLSMNAERSVTVQVSPERLVFTPQDYAAKTVVVSARGDADLASGQAVVSHAVTGGDYGENNVTAADVTVTVTDTGSVTSDIGVTLDNVVPLPEGGGAQRLEATVTLLSGALDALTVPLTVTGTGANPAGPEDFQVNPAQLAAEFPAGVDTRTVTFMLTPVNDGVVEGDETLLVSAMAPAGSGLEVDDGIVLTITDDDVREVRVTPTTLALNERERSPYTVSLGSQPEGEVTVTVTPMNTTDVELRVTPGELVFTAQDYGEQTVMVFVRGDEDLVGGDVEIANSVQGADYGLNSVTAPAVTVTVTDNSDVVVDLRMTLDDTRPLPEEGGARTLVATVEKLNPDLQDEQVVTQVSVAGAGTSPAGPEDFQAQPPEFTVSIPAGQTAGTATFTLTPVNDGLDEDDETVRVSLAVVTGSAPDGMPLELDDPVDLTIVDNDTRGVTVSPPMLALDEGMQGTYTVSLGSQPSAAVTVTVTASGSDSVTASPSSLVFTTENWRTAQQVTVVSEEDLNPNDETLTVSHTVSGGDYEGVAAPTMTVTVSDDDRPSREVRLSVTPDAILEGAVGDAATLTVRGELDATARMDEMTVTLAVPRGMGYMAAMATLTIAAESLTGTVQLPLTLMDDEVDRADVEVTIRAMTDAIATLTDGTTQPMRLAPESLTVTITDNDDRGVTVTPTARTILEGESATYEVVLRSAPDGREVTVMPTLADADANMPTGAEVLPPSLTFMPDDWDTPQTVTVTVMDDTNVELDALATVSHEVSGADYGANDVTAASVTVTVPGFEEMLDGSVQLIITPEYKVTVSDEVSMTDLRGIEVRLFPPRLEGMTVAVVQDTSVETRPQGSRADDVLVDITLEIGVSLMTGETAIVCLPTDSPGRRVYHYDAAVTPPEWVLLDSPPGGSPDGLACGVTTSFSVFALGAVPGDETQGWLARFGRTMASQIVDTVGTRLNAPTARQAKLSLGGSAPQSALLSGVFNVLSGKTAVDAKQALAKSSFVLPLSEGDGAHWTAWGRGTYTEFDGKEGTVDLDGEVMTGMVGMDLAHGDWLAGVALSHSEADGDSLSDDGDRGEMEITMTSLNPYAKIETDGGLTAWGVAGYGGGDMKRERDGTETEVDLEMQMAAVGLEGQVGTIRSKDGMFNLRLKADALAVRMDADGTEEMPEVEADAQRFRLLMSGNGRYPSASGGTMAPMLEAGLRWDEGDAETGMGFEMGAGFRFSDSGGRFSTELTARGLVAHEESDYDEWGVGGSVVLGPEQGGRGLSVKLNSGYGSVASETQALWSRRDLAGLAPEQSAALVGRLGLGLGYGFNGPGGRGILMPYLEYRDEISTELRVGARLDFGEAMRVELSALRRREENQGFQFQVKGRW